MAFLLFSLQADERLTGLFEELTSVKQEDKFKIIKSLDVIENSPVEDTEASTDEHHAEIMESASMLMSMENMNNGEHYSYSLLFLCRQETINFTFL